ncbi:hypothetical protein J8J42_02795 [Chryseobacterium sp. cx-311]|nr:hypothetical protein [Marnyiella aurantia]
MKEIGGDVVRAELIEYASATAFEVDYSNLHRFTGTVTAYNESRQAVAVGSFETGDNPACPPSPGNGGAGIEPVAPLPGNPEDSYNPLPTPGWPSGPGSTEIPPPPPTEGCIPKEKKEVAVVAGLTMMTDGCIVWFEGVFTPSTSKLSPHCNDGSGVIILPGTKPKTPVRSDKRATRRSGF